MTLVRLIQVAGALQVLLALAHLLFPRRFGWKAELQAVSLLTRQIFWVHVVFIALTVGGFGILSLACAAELAERGTLARAVSGGLAAFWTLRWIFQFFVYRPELWRGNRLHTAVHVGFAALWTFLAAVYGTAFARQF